MTTLKMQRTYLLVLFCLCNGAICNSEWVDPFNVDFVAEKPESNVDPFTIDFYRGDERPSTCSQPSNNGMLFYKRTINLMLASLMLDEISNTYKGRLFINVAAQDYKVLKEFTNSDTMEHLMLQKIDQILTNALEMTLVDKVELAFMKWTDICYSLLATRTTGFMVIILAVMLVVYKLFQAKFTTKRIIYYVLFMGWMFDFGFTWKRMLQDLEINKYVDSLRQIELPADCFPQKMTAWQTVTNFFRGSTDCKEYYKMLMYDVVFDVGPLDVIARQSRVLIQVCSNFGSAISLLVKGLLDGLPFPLNIILLIPMMIFTILIICTLLTFSTNTNVSINMMHLFQLHLKKNRPERIISRDEIQEVESIKDVLKEMITEKKGSKSLEVKVVEKESDDVLPEIKEKETES